MSITDKKYNSLLSILKDMGRVVVAFSGGTDSTFLLAAAKQALHDEVTAVTVKSVLHPDFEVDEAEWIAAQLEVRHRIVDAGNLIQGKELVSNPVNRCYICKTDIFKTLQATAEKESLGTVIDGSNTDDEGDFRPGMKALQELGIRSPLKEAGLSKQEIRKLSKALNLTTWDKPAQTCLATRIPYGSRITLEKLKRIEKAEKALRQLGFSQIRVRDHGDIARIEVPAGERIKLIEDATLSDMIVMKFKVLGYHYVTMDIEGYRTGSMNEVLKNNE